MSTANKKRTSILVVGGAGFIGRHVCAELTRQGHDVVSMGRGPQPAGSRIQHVSADMADTAAADRSIKQADVVIALAANSLPATSNTDLADEVDRHVVETVRLAERCAASGVRQLIFASSGGTVYGNRSGTLLDEDTTPEPITAYGVSKLAIENYLRVLSLNSSLNTLSLRISNPYGPGQRTSRRQGLIAVAVERALSDTPITIWGDGTATRDFVAVHDVARAFANAVGYEGRHKVINIGSGAATKLNDVVSLVERTTGRSIAVIHEDGRTCDVQHNSLSICRAQDELNWVPTISLDEGIARYVHGIDPVLIDLSRRTSTPQHTSPA